MPTTIMGLVLDTVVVSRDVEGASYEEMGWCVNSCLLCLFTTSIRAHLFVSSVVTPWGYKAGNRPYVNLRPLSRPPTITSPPSLWL
jgi:hypothetical protein